MVPKKRVVNENCFSSQYEFAGRDSVFFLLFFACFLNFRCYTKSPDPILTICLNVYQTTYRASLVKGGIICYILKWNQLGPLIEIYEPDFAEILLWSKPTMRSIASPLLIVFAVTHSARASSSNTLYWFSLGGECSNPFLLPISINTLRQTA